MIKRTLTPFLIEIFKKYPVLTVTGPRQSGKTTLIKNSFPHLPYVNLENLEIRQALQYDPKAFIKTYKDGAIIDEFQHVPELTSWLQVHVDEKRKNGMFVLSGSQQLDVMQNLSQSLAGRTSLFKLLPFSFEELHSEHPKLTTDEEIYSGFYPRIHTEKIEPRQALSDYLSTYIERDIRSLKQIHSLSLFQKFVSLCAGRIGQILNLSNLASDTGISHTTASQWLSILEASYVIFLLKPWHANIGKRLIRAPKLYFYDVGLAAHLLHIENKTHVASHPLRGNLFENMIVSEALKYRYHRGENCNLWFYRDAKGHEVDLVISNGADLFPIEIKAGETVPSGATDGIKYFNSLFPTTTEKEFVGALIHGGDLKISRDKVLLGDRYDIEKIFDASKNNTH